MLHRLKQGDEKAFESIYAHYSPKMYGNLLKLLKSTSLAAEVLQDVFVKIWDYRHSIDSSKSFSAFLFKIAENRIYDIYRKSARDKKLAQHFLKTATEAYEHIETTIYQKEHVHFLQKAVDKLPTRRKQIFTLCKLEGRSYEEVSCALGISVSTISDHIVKANRTIKDYLLAHPDRAILLLCILHF
jgi:RNA polymerase sigma-70 factor (ECF subfamily)